MYKNVQRIRIHLPTGHCWVDSETMAKTPHRKSMKLFPVILVVYVNSVLESYYDVSSSIPLYRLGIKNHMQNHFIVDEIKNRGGRTKHSFI